jgi:hypothetical protein
MPEMEEGDGRWVRRGEEMEALAKFFLAGALCTKKGEKRREKFA